MLRKCGSILKINNVKQTMSYWVTKLEFTPAIRVENTGWHPMLLYSLWSTKTKIKIVMSVWCLFSLHLLWLPDLAAKILVQTSFKEFPTGKATVGFLLMVKPLIGIPVGPEIGT